MLKAKLTTEYLLGCDTVCSPDLLDSKSFVHDNIQILCNMAKRQKHKQKNVRKNSLYAWIFADSSACIIHIGCTRFCSVNRGKNEDVL